MPKGVGYGGGGSPIKGVSIKPVQKLKSPKTRLAKRLMRVKTNA